MKRLGIAFGLLVLMMGVAPDARASGERVVKKQYVGAPASAGLVFCGAPRPAVDGVGRTCFLIEPGETRLSVDLDDLSDSPVAGAVLFFGKPTGVGEPLDIRGIVPFCGGVADVAIPEGATHLDIDVGDRAGAASMPCGTPTTGTVGIATASFS